MTDKIRWGILSTARIGRNAVIPAIQHSRNGEVVAVASRDGARARLFADELGIERTYDSYEALLADPNIDAIYNPLPNDQHAMWSIRAAEAGKHVLCEKPLASDAAEAEQMVHVFKEQGRLLTEAFMYRFHPRTQQVLEMVRGGAVGDLHFIIGAFTFALRDEANIRLFGSMAGGAIMDVGCYAVGIMRFITGEEPVAWNAFAHFNDRNADEFATGSLVFPSGVLGHFDCGVRTFGRNGYEISGSTGRIVVEGGFRPRDGQPTKILHWQGDSYNEIEFAPVDQYQLMVEDFADAILNGRPPRYPAEDAVLSMRLLDGLRESARANQAQMPAAR